MQFLWVYADDLMGKGLEISIILELMVYASARLVNMALPLSILMSSIMTLGALSEHYELTAMKSAGLSLFRLLRPLIIVITFIGIGSFYFSNNIWPIANLKFRVLLYSVTKQKPALNLDDGVFYNGIDGFSIRVTKKDPETKELHDVLIYDHREASEGSRTVIRADHGDMKQTDDKRYLMLTLYDGFSYDEQKENTRRPEDRSNPHVVNQFEKQIMRIDLSSLDFQKSDEDLFKNAYEMMRIDQIEEAVDSIDVRILRKQADIERFGNRMVRMYRDTMDLSSVAPNETLRKGFLTDLSFAQQKRAFEVAKEISRSNKKNLENALIELRGKKNLRDKHLIEWHRKFFLGFSCIVLFFIGAPLGAIIRKGGLGLPTVIAILLFLVYYITTIFGERMVKAGTLTPVIGMWISTVVLFPMSVFLTYKAATDSSIMNIDAYKAWFKKTFKRKNANSTTV